MASVDTDGEPLLRPSAAASSNSSSLNASDPQPLATFQPRLATIASIVNTMMGTTILALPFGMSQAGIGVGVVVTALVGSVSCATCLIVVERGLLAGHDSFAGSVEAHLGRRVQHVAWAFSAAIILGAAIVYHILMGETLFALVNAVAPAAVSGGWSRTVAALVPWAIYPICALKDLSLLVRFNSVGAARRRVRRALLSSNFFSVILPPPRFIFLFSAGFIFMAYTMFFICFHGVRTLAGGHVVTRATTGADAPPYSDSGDFYLTTLGSTQFAGMGGMVRRRHRCAGTRSALFAHHHNHPAPPPPQMMLSFYLHNVVQPIVKNANPKTRRVDIAVGYMIAASLYSVVGVLGYLGFADSHAWGSCAASAVLPAGALPCRPLSSDFLAAFGSGLGSALDAYTFSARASLYLQLLTVFPILLLIIREQVWTLFKGVAYPSVWHVAGLNAVMMAVTTTFSALDVKIGEVLRFVGAVGGFVVVFAVPAGMEAVARACIRWSCSGGGGHHKTE